jgi:hypothetical protein
VKIVSNDKLKRSLEKRYWRLTRKVFVKVRQPVVDKAERIDPSRLKDYVRDLLLADPMRQHIDDIWGKVGGKFAYDTEKVLQGSKSKTHSIEVKAAGDQLKLWEDRLRKYSNERSLQKTGAILDTEVEAINKVIDDVIADTLDKGLGVLESRREMVRALTGDELSEMENWQAERIARTEVNSAGNTGSFDAAQENSEGVRKEWSTSGLPNIRDSHIEYEAMGVVDMDYEYNTGLQFPGDPDCNLAEEVINCRCTIIYDTGN